MVMFWRDRGASLRESNKRGHVKVELRLCDNQKLTDLVEKLFVLNSSESRYTMFHTLDEDNELCLY